MGDLAVTVAFELARVVRKAPRAIAQELVTALGSIDGIAAIEAAPNGYLNFFVDRPAFLTVQLTRSAATVGPTEAAPPKTIVEHTAINPNKAAHIGHLRNAALGDTLGRLLRFQGVPVEIQNYIDDTGVQVADMVVAFQELESKGLGAVRELAAAPAASITAAGISTPGSPSGTKRIQPACRPVARPCTPSRRAATMRR